MRTTCIFASIHVPMEGFAEYNKKFADTYIFPDDPLYPHSQDIVRVERMLSVTSKGFKQVYKPSGYFD